MNPKISKPLTVAVVGATGIVGKEFIQILQEREFPVKKLKLFASERSAGESVNFRSKPVKVEELAEGCFKGCDVAFFSAGGKVSEKWGPIAVSEGSFVIDNSSAFRMKADVPLIVPEVNSDQIPTHLAKPILIANPNCSTIQLVVALKPIHDHFKLKSVIVSTYQSVSGAGKAGIEELNRHTQDLLNGKTDSSPEVFSHPIAFNNLPQIDVFDPETGFTFEEKKIMQETRKIMGLNDLDISATAVRTPTLNAHSEAVWIDVEKEVTRVELLECLKNAPGIEIVDDIGKRLYPLNRNASGKDEVFIGRVRRDPNNKKRWLMWIVSDNIRKGAALNGIQIAEKLFASCN